MRNAPDDRLKVFPSIFDREAFLAAIGDDASAKEQLKGHRIVEADRFFRDAIRSWATADRTPEEASRRVETLSNVLWKLLVVVAIDLDAQDNAQVIFETLNARGTPLLAADLIKNHLFQAAKAGGADIDALYATYWQPLDRNWWREDVQAGRLNRPRLDIFLNHWLAMRLGREVIAHQLFREFKRFLEAEPETVMQLLDELGTYASVYERFEREPDGSDMERFLYRLNTMEVTTAYPFLLWLFGPEGIKDEAERLRSVAAIESWLARRVILRANTQGYSSIFLALLANLRKVTSPTARDVATYLRGLEGERGYWPSDELVSPNLLTMPLYSVLLRKLANDP